MAGDPNRTLALASDLERENVQFPAYSPREESEPILHLLRKGRASIAVFGELHDLVKPFGNLIAERDAGHNIATAKCILPKIL
jgi:predicted phosphohydrolase